MEGYTRIRKIGGSLMATIPKEIVKEETLRPGELVRIEIEKPKKSGFGILKGLAPFTHEDELDTHD